jgi:acylphosphatase
MMSKLASLHAVVSGHVQGVYFRAFVCDRALMLGLTGYVRNMPEGDAVEICGEGDSEKLDQLLDYVKTGPPRSRVDKVKTDWSEYTGKCSKFEIQY